VCGANALKVQQAEQAAREDTTMPFAPVKALHHCSGLASQQHCQQTAQL